ISPYIEPRNSPLASCCGRGFTAWPPWGGESRGEGWSVGRAVTVVCAARPWGCCDAGLLRGGHAALDGLPDTVDDLVDGQLLVGGVAVLVEGDLAGDAVEGGLLDGVDDLGAGVGGDLAVLHDGADGLDDRGGGVVGVRAVGAVVTGVLLGLV